MIDIMGNHHVVPFVYDDNFVECTYACIRYREKPMASIFFKDSLIFTDSVKIKRISIRQHIIQIQNLPPFLRVSVIQFDFEKTVFITDVFSFQTYENGFSPMGLISYGQIEFHGVGMVKFTSNNTELCI